MKGREVVGTFFISLTNIYYVMPAVFHSTTFQKIILIVITFIFYGNTLKNDYALDDAIVITKNEFTKQGIKGLNDIFKHDSFTGFFGKQKNLVAGGRYRPLSVATFAIEYEFFGQNPFISHFINVLLYAFTGILILVVINKILPSQKSSMIAFFTALLFVIHPIHTEVVANIKSRDEILALLFGLASIWFTLKYLNKKKIYFMIISGLMLFLALLSKENAIVFAAFIPIVLFIFRRKMKMSQYVLIISQIAFFVILFLIIRSNVLHEMINSEPQRELMNNPFWGAGKSEKTGTILYTLALYLKLLFWPHPLTYDYYPYHIKLMPLSSIVSLLSLVIYISLIVISLWAIIKRKSWSLPLIIYLLPLLIVSNIFFPIGTFMNERFLYFSSLGFCIGIAILLNYIVSLKKTKIPTIVLLALVIILSGFKTITRNRVWKDDFTLFTTDVKTSINSTKSNCTAGGALLEKAQKTTNKQLKAKYLDQSISYLQRALIIYPKYVDALLLAGNAKWEKYHVFDSTWQHYNVLLKKYNGHPLALSNMKTMARQSDSVREKIVIYKKILDNKTNDFDSHYNLGVLYGKYLHQIDSSKFYLAKALDISPDNIDALKDMGVALSLSGKYEESLIYFQKVLKQNANDRNLLINIGLSYRQLGRLKEAETYFKKAELIKTRQ